MKATSRIAQISRFYASYLAYLFMIFSIELSYITGISYVGIAIIMVSLLGAIEVFKLFSMIALILKDDSIVKNYRLSLMFIFPSIVLGAVGVSVSIKLMSLSLAIFSTVVPYLLSLLGTYLFRESCIIISKNLGLYSMKTLGDTSLIVALIYPVYFLIPVPYSLVFLSIIYVVLASIAYKAFKSLEGLIGGHT
ncbi:MAG: hypothetical protein J7K58_02555 [Euryarchaeota archaeon]|nr:hypothetical protein [Euryarchaeota archaeon]